MAFALTPAALADLENDVANGNDFDTELARRGWTREQYDQARAPRQTAQVQPIQGAPIPAPLADGRAPLPSAVGRIAPPGVDGRAPLPSAVGPAPVYPAVAAQTYQGQAPDWALFQRNPAAYQAWLANQAAVASAVASGQIGTPSAGVQQPAAPRQAPTPQQQQAFAVTPATRADLEQDVAAGNDLDAELARRGWTRATIGMAPTPTAPVTAPAPVAAPEPNLPNPNPPPVTPQAPFTAPAGPSIPTLPAPRMEGGQVVTPVPQATYDWGTTLTPNPMDDYARRYAQWEREYAAWQTQYGTAWQQQQQVAQTQRQAGVPTGGYYPDASMGNPEPGKQYAQVITPVGSSGYATSGQPATYGAQQQPAPSAATDWEGRTSAEAGYAPGFTYRGGRWTPDQQQPQQGPTNSLQNLQAAQAQMQPQAAPAQGQFVAPMGSQGTALGNQVSQANSYLANLPSPQRVNVAAMRRLPQSAQDFAVSGYSQLGYDEGDIKEQWDRMLPTAVGPRRGFVAPLGAR
jgi:hypothetical protein